MNALLVLALLPNAALPVIGVSDAGSEVHIIASGFVASDGHLDVSEDRIEVRLKERPTGAARVVVEDKVVKRIEVAEGDPPRLSIQTRWGPKTTARIAKVAVLETLPDGIRIRLPHDVEHPSVAPTVAPPSPSPSVSPSPTVIMTAPREEKKAEPSPSAPENAMNPGTKPEPSASPKASSEPLTKKKDGLSGLGLAEDHAAGGGMAWAFVGILALGAICLLAWLKQRKGLMPELTDVSVLSSTAVGPKTRLVLVAVQSRQLLLSVSDRGAELLTELNAEESPRTARAERTEARAEPTPEARPNKSAAINGLLE
ncbi:MAG: flagellar biosynthetic protein FliO, partial [Myxococcota bacterium]